MYIIIHYLDLLVIEKMGACYSYNTSPKLKNNITVIHFNGFVEYFDQPTSASQVIGNTPKHFLCTSIQLLSSFYKPLKGDSQLQSGQLYFLLPFSILQASDFSPVDMACLAKRLTAKAKIKPCDNKKSSTVTPLLSQTNWTTSPARSPCRMQPWKPILDTITEKPFNTRSESDLQDITINV
ncbi:uncharacterized protein [Cicer arietinum]|uniref:Uncharacterized protein LOC101506348 n=1 Tax=Cicer arietinum TaxID=3827 RepID=A0A1S2YPF3_CICAR|nr:uncharacterized protein LOC101506348 [Cicer arietinum]